VKINPLRATLGFALIVMLAGCAHRGLLSERYDPGFYQVPQLRDSSAAATNPTFLVYGDNQGCFRLIENFGKRHNWWTWKQALIPLYQLYWLSNGVVGAVNVVRYAPDGGKATRLRMRDNMFAAASAANADFILNTGDICAHDGRYPAHWRKFLKECKTNSPLLREVPFVPTAGNHERTTDFEFGRPNFQAVFGRENFYSLKFKDAELFVIDSEIICDLYAELDDSLQQREYERWIISGDSARPAWLERELRACEKPVKMISMHIPPISFGRHFRDWTGDNDFGPDIPAKRRAFLKLLRETGVQVVFSGHEHVYQHNILHFPADAALPASDLHVVVSSGGGVPQRQLPSRQDYDEQTAYFTANGYDVEIVRHERNFHYCEVTVSPGEISIKTIALPRALPEHAFELETFSIPARGM
jgi:hypothetical protein